jgi:hypothetical protein
MGWSGLSLTYTFQIDEGSDDSHTISKYSTIRIEGKSYENKEIRKCQLPPASSFLNIIFLSLEILDYF